MEGEGSSVTEMEKYTEIETTSYSFDNSVVFHLVKNILEAPDIQGVILIIGPSPARSQHVYELCFSHEKVVPAGGFVMSKAGEGLSKKVIRALISKGAGSSSYSGPSKLFLLVKAPSTINMPQYFLPKREFKINKRIAPLRLSLKCKRDVLNHDSQTVNLAVLPIQLLQS